MDRCEKKQLVIGIFNFREVLHPFLEPGRSAPFPGASRMIREVSHVCNEGKFTKVFQANRPERKLNKVGKWVHGISLTMMHSHVFCL